MSERDPLPALRGLIDEPIAPRSAFADELRARLLTELGSHRPAAINEERTMEITTPGLQLVLPGERVRHLPSWRRFAEIAALVVLVFGVIAVFASERVGSPTNPPPTSQGNLGVYPPSLATPDPNVVNGAERDLGVLWKITDIDPNVPLVDVSTFMGTTFFLMRDEVLSVDSASGAINWRTSVPRGWGLLTDAQGIYVTTSANADDIGSSNLLKLGYRTGEQVWSAPVGLYPGSPLLGEGIIYVWNSANQLHAISAGGGTELWSEDYSHSPLSTLSVQNAVDSSGRLPVAILDGENLIVGTSDARVGSIHIAGSENHDWNWNSQLEFTNQPGFELAIAGDSVAAIAVTSRDLEFRGQLTVWDRTTGEELWAGDETKDYESVISTGTAFAIAVHSRLNPATPFTQQNVFDTPSIYTTTAFDPRSGAELWSAIELRPTYYDRANSLLFAMTNNVWTAALVPETGEVLGSAYPSGFLVSRLSADTRAVYGQQWGGTLVAVDINAFKNGTLEGGEIPGSTPEAIQSPEADSALLWQTKPEGDVRRTGQSVVSNGTVFRLLTTSDFQGVEAYDTATGTLLWRHAVQGTELVADDSGVYVTLGRYANPEMSITVSATPDYFVIGPNDASVIKLDPQTGDELWSANTGTGESSPVLIDDTLYLLESTDSWNVARGMTQEATAIDSSTGSILWSETVGVPMGQGLAGGYASMVATNSNLVALLGSGLMVGIDRSNGAVLWERVRFDPLNLGLSIDASGDTVVVSVHAATTSLNYWLPEFPELQSGSAVIAYNATDGTPLWAFDTGGVDSGIVVANHKVITKVFPSVLREKSDPLATPVGQFSETSFEIVGIDISTGEVVWQGYGGDGDRGDLYLVPSADDGSVILVDNRGYSYTVIETATGGVAQSPLSFGQPIQGAPVADSERVYIQLKDGTLVAAALTVPAPQLSQDEIADLLPETGGPLPASVVWHVDQDVAWPPEAFGLPLGGMAVSDGIVYRALSPLSFASEEAAVSGIEAYDAASGELLWQLPIRLMVSTIAAGDGSVFTVINTTNNENGPATSWALVALDGQTGDERWRIEFEDDSPFRGPDYDPSEDVRIDLLTYGNGMLYAANSSSVVTAFDAQTGNELWKSAAPPNRAIMHQGTAIEEGTVTEAQEDASQGSQLSITVSGDRIFVVTQNGSVVALDSATGDLSGEAIPSSTENTTAPVLIGNLLIVGNTVWDYSDDGLQVGKSGTLTAFDVSNNYAIVWEKQVGLSADNVVAIDDAVFVTTMTSGQDSVVQRIDPATGDALWSTGNLGQFLYLRKSIGPDGSLVAASFYEGTINSISPETGDVLSSSDNLPALAIEPGDNGLYFATLLDGALVAINPNSWAVDQNLLQTETATALPSAPEATATP